MKERNWSDIISWGLTILLILTVIYVRYGTEDYCPPEKVNVIEICKGEVISYNENFNLSKDFKENLEISLNNIGEIK